MRSTPLSPARGPRGALGGPASRCRIRQALASAEGRLLIARRSRRRRFRRGPRSIARTNPLPPGGSETSSSTWASNGFRFARRLCEILGTRPANPALPILRPRSFNGLGFGLHQDEPLCAPLLIPPPRGFRHRVEAVPKSLLPRRPFGLCLGRANPRLDDLKVQRATDSGKRAIVHLSTSRLNASGQQWITQRFVAEWAAYPRSRCASRRSRSALSLMKPCASCWS